MKNQRQWTFRLALVAVLALAWLLGGAGLARADDDAPFVPNQVVVKLNPASGARIRQINATYRTRTQEVLLGSAAIYLLRTRPGTDIEQLVSAMSSDARLLYAEPNYIGSTPEGDPSDTWAWGGPDPVPYGEQYAAEALNLACAHTVEQGAGVVVAVLDTGVRLDHPALAPFLVAGYDFVSDDATPDDEGVPAITNLVGHGTHVAGIVHLVAPQAGIMPLRVLDTTGRGNMFVLAEAILFAASRGADVLNISLGTAAESDLIADVLGRDDDDGIDDGIDGDAAALSVAAAAGNLNSLAEQYPAAEEGVLAVTAIDENRVKADFANFGAWVSVAAPGVGIYSTFPPIDGSGNGYASWSGTSMATPFVAGQAALLHAAYPAISPAQVVTVIQGTAQSLDGANPPYAGQLGAGLPDIAASLGASCAAP